MTIEQLLKQLVEKNFKASQSEYWGAVAVQAKRHNKRKLLGERNDLVDSLRPNEDEVSKAHRQANERQITIEPVYRFKRKVSRLMEFSYVLSPYLEQIEFDPKFYAQAILDQTFEDPNSGFVIFPINPNDEALPPNALNRDTEVQWQIKTLDYTDLIYYDREYVVFNFVEIEVNKMKHKTYVIGDKNNWYWVKPVYRDNRFVYEIELWYNHGASKLPFVILPGVAAYTNSNEWYQESYLLPAYMYFDEVITAFSDNQIVRARYNYPKTVMADISCPEIGCNNGYIFEFDKDGRSVKGDDGMPRKHTCQTCKGTGKILDPSIYSTLTVPQKMLTESGTNLSSVLQYIHADVSILKESYFTPFDLLEKGSKAIGLDLLEDAGANSSDLSLSRRQEDLLDMIKTVAEYTYDALDAMMYHIEVLKYPNESQRGESHINRPSSFEIKSPEELLVLAQTALFEDRVTARINYYKTKYKNQDRLIAVYEMALKTTPSLALTFEEQTNYLAAGIIDSYDMIKSMHVFNALDEVYSEGMNVKQANDAIKNYLVDNGFWVEPEAEISKPTENKLLATVGGVTSIVEISRAVSAGEMTESAAENLLVTVFGIKSEEAKKLIELPSDKMDSVDDQMDDIDTDVI
ncbi:MAG TPA: hypothetical protein PLU58_13895, partial [Saprospiraceae bacterium]|nr:hypothetical protein [Saprospiraceae bacterium]